MLTRGYGRDGDPVGMAGVMPTSPELDPHRTPVGAVLGTGADPQVGSFRFWFEDQRWEWSDEVFRIYGYEPRSVVPTTMLVMSHKHPDDRDDLEDLLDRARHSGGSFSSRHRLCDTAGQEHSVVVVAERMLDETDAVVGASGFFIDLTEALEHSRRDLLDETLPRLFEARSIIEQAKGALMLVYGMNDEQAFKILQWRSQENNAKLRALATQLVTELETVTSVTSALRTEFDHLIMTLHERAPANRDV